MFISNSMHLSPAPAGVSGNKPLIGYRNIVTASNVTASSQAAGFPGSSVGNPLTAERWKPVTLPATITVDAGAAVDVNYFGLAGHTFAANGCVVSISYSTDGATYTEIADVLPGDGKPLMFVFDEITARYWRVSIDGDAVPSLAVLYIGQVLECPYGIYGGHTPIQMGRKTKVIRNKTEGGQFAGVSIITEGVQTSIELKHLTATWYRQYFEPFVVAARGMPFFFAWRISEFPYEVGYVWTTGDIRPVNMGIRNLMQVSIEVEGYSDD